MYRKGSHKHNYIVVFLTAFSIRVSLLSTKVHIPLFNIYEGWNFNSGNYLFTTDTK